jgi:hypothetical protein
MFKTLLKRKLKEDKLANVFVNSIITLVDDAFPDVADMINEDPIFEIKPQIGLEDSDKFLLVVLAGNIQCIPDYFEAYQDIRITDAIFRKLSNALSLELEVLKKIIGQYQSFCSKMNHPSKNTIYGMSKGVFYKYNLSDHQEEFFKNMRTANPIFLKRMDEIMANFLFDWSSYQNKYRIVS